KPRWNRTSHPGDPFGPPLLRVDYAGRTFAYQSSKPRMRRGRPFEPCLQAACVQHPYVGEYSVPLTFLLPVALPVPASRRNEDKRGLTGAQRFEVVLPLVIVTLCLGARVLVVAQFPTRRSGGDPYVPYV